MLEQLLKFKSDVRLGRKEVVFNEILLLNLLKNKWTIGVKSEDWINLRSGI